MNHAAASFYKNGQRLWHDQTGAVYSIETILVATLFVVGAIAAIAATRDSVISELSDVAGSVQDVNHSFSYLGARSASASSAGAQYVDQTDVFDTAGDVAGAADNCITFDIPGLNEGDDLEAFFSNQSSSLSDPASLEFDSVITGTNGSATGTLGDGTIETGFTITTTGGNVSTVQATFANELRFFESDSSSGPFTITFDDPVTDVEFFVRNFTNTGVDGHPENLLGDFTITLSDGTVLNNAAFTVNPEAITPNTNLSAFFRTGSNETDQLSVVTRGGSQFVTDPTLNGTGNQAAGRITFDDVPVLGNPTGPGAVGISSIMFQRTGGPAGFRASFSLSGQVIE